MTTGHTGATGAAGETGHTGATGAAGICPVGVMDVEWQRDVGMQIAAINSIIAKQGGALGTLKALGLALFALVMSGGGWIISTTIRNDASITEARSQLGDMRHDSASAGEGLNGLRTELARLSGEIHGAREVETQAITELSRRIGIVEERQSQHR